MSGLNWWVGNASPHFQSLLPFAGFLKTTRVSCRRRVCCSFSFSHQPTFPLLITPQAPKHPSSAVGRSELRPCGYRLLPRERERASPFRAPQTLIRGSGNSEALSLPHVNPLFKPTHTKPNPDNNVSGICHSLVLTN